MCPHQHMVPHVTLQGPRVDAAVSGQAAEQEVRPATLEAVEPSGGARRRSCCAAGDISKAACCMYPCCGCCSALPFVLHPPLPAAASELQSQSEVAQYAAAASAPATIAVHTSRMRSSGIRHEPSTAELVALAIRDASLPSAAAWPARQQGNQLEHGIAVASNEALSCCMPKPASSLFWHFDVCRRGQWGGVQATGT